MTADMGHGYFAFVPAVLVIDSRVGALEPLTIGGQLQLGRAFGLVSPPRFRDCADPFPTPRLRAVPFTGFGLRYYESTTTPAAARPALRFSRCVGLPRIDLPFSLRPAGRSMQIDLDVVGRGPPARLLFRGRGRVSQVPR